MRLEIELLGRVTGEDGRPPADADRFSTLVDRMTEELIALDVDDPFVGADLREGAIEIHLVVEAGSEIDAFEAAATLIRAAFHAAGLGTAGWQPRLQVERFAKALSRAPRVV